MQSSKVLWGEGLFLRPQHFQRQDAYHEWRLVEMSRALHPYAWGVRSLKVATDALQGGVLRLTELHVIERGGLKSRKACGQDIGPGLQAWKIVAPRFVGDTRRHDSRRCVLRRDRNSRNQCRGRINHGSSYRGIYLRVSGNANAHQ